MKEEGSHQDQGVSGSFWMGFGKGKDGQAALDYLGKERELQKTIWLPLLKPCDVWLAIESMGNSTHGIFL